MYDMNVLERHLYKEALDSASNFNTRLLVERQSRLPFLDTQTNIAQINCHLWKKACERVDSTSKGMEYSYQQRFWKRLPKSKQEPQLPDIAAPDAPPDVKPSIDPPIKVSHEEAKIIDEEVSLDAPSSNATPEEMSPLSDEFEGYYDRKRKRQSRSSTKRTRASGGPVDNLRKTSRSRKSSVVSTRNTRSKNEEIAEASPPTTEPVKSYDPSTQPVDEKGKKIPSTFCDFCLGDNVKNKKSGVQEEMISCSDCGRSAHPSCLQFEGGLAENVKSYNWQCIECKSCTVCGTSDNDHQLLFCDECDRGYHMYCLNPRIENPPEGRWECHICKK